MAKSYRINCYCSKNSIFNDFSFYVFVYRHHYIFEYVNTLRYMFFFFVQIEIFAYWEFNYNLLYLFFLCVQIKITALWQKLIHFVLDYFQLKCLLKRNGKRMSKLNYPKNKMIKMCNEPKEMGKNWHTSWREVLQIFCVRANIPISALNINIYWRFAWVKRYKMLWNMSCEKECKRISGVDLDCVCVCVFFFVLF